MTVIPGENVTADIIVLNIQHTAKVFKNKKKEIEKKYSKFINYNMIDMILLKTKERMRLDIIDRIKLQQQEKKTFSADSNFGKKILDQEMIRNKIQKLYDICVTKSQIWIDLLKIKRLYDYPSVFDELFVKILVIKYI